MLGADDELSIEVNPWPDKQRTGESLRKRWASSGLLWVDPVVSRRMELHIQDKPRIQYCPVEGTM